jgi:UDP-N-acetylglucosamine acyltransferase
VTIIDSTARIAPGARIGERVSIGPFCIVGPDAVVGDDCQLIANVIVTGHSELGPRNVVHPFAVLGGAPQSVSYRGEATRLTIGADNTIRESVTMNLGTPAGGGNTKVGSGGYFMASAHVAHDCRVGDNVQFANGAVLGGHCEVGDYAVLSGYVAVHQFGRIGTGAIVSGGAIVRSDIVPFAIAAGEEARLIGVNMVGMRRRKFSPASIAAVRAAYRQLFLSSGPWAERLNQAETAHGSDPLVAKMIEFLRAPSRRPLCHARRGAIDNAQADTAT